MNIPNIPDAKTKVISEKNVEEKDDPIKNNLTNVNSEAANSGAAIGFFIIITTIFTIIIYVTLPNDESIYSNNNINLYVLIYVLVIVVGNYLINLNISTSVCGEVQWSTTLINTIIPWVIIFGLLNICLIIFPGWISPFANTIGFGVINILGLKSLLDKILNRNRDNPDSKPNPLNDLVNRGIEEIYGNNSLFINQIPTSSEEFKKFVTILQNTGYFKKDLNPSSIIQLFKFLKLKELVGKYVWNLLTGILVTSVSYNFIVNSQCDNSVKKLQEKRNNFLLEEKKKQRSKENNRVYYPFVIGENNDDIDVKSSSYSTTKT
jgi:hypothetical protein